MPVKCSALRAVKNEFKLCCRVAKPDFVAFCTYEHDKEARELAGQEHYDRHIQHARQVAGDRQLEKVFNDNLRVAFGSVIEANMKRREQEFLQKSTADYARSTRNAWQGVADIVNANAEQVQNDIQETKQVRKAVKRNRNNAFNLAVTLYDTESESLTALYDKTPQSCAGSSMRKKVRFESEDFEVHDNPLAGCDGDDELMHRAVNAPLPAGDSMELEEELDE